MTEIGEYVFEKFFDGDLDRVRSQNPKKSASFRALAERCGTPELHLSASALAAAVNVAVMGRRLPETATAFKQLPPSHQVTLLPLRDPVKVERIAQRAVSKELSVRELKAIVTEEVAKRPADETPRGRPPTPFILKALQHSTRALTSESGRLTFTKAHVDELSEEQAAEALKAAQALLSGLEKLLEKLSEK